MGRMIKLGDYSIKQELNVITICCPQTWEQRIDTVTPIAKISMLDSDQLKAVLILVRSYCELNGMCDGNN